MNQKALKTLEYTKIITQLESHAASPLGKSLCRDLVPSSDLEEVRTWQAQTTDAADACCGTHVETTGEVGIIKLRTMINYKGGVRISMLCGRRALIDYRERLKDEIRISNLLSAKLALVPEAVEKLKNESQEKDMVNGRLCQQLLEKKVESYPESGEVMAVFEEGLSPVQLRQLSTMLYEKGKGKIVGVFSGKEEEQVYQYALGSSQADMRKLSKAMNSELNGRGGGSELMAQGTFKAGEKEIREVLIREAGKLE